MRDGRDSNSQRPAWQAGALTKLNYHPFFFKFNIIDSGIITQYPRTKIIGESFVDKKLSVSPRDIKIYPIIIKKSPIPKIK